MREQQHQHDRTKQKTQAVSAKRSRTLPPATESRAAGLGTMIARATDPRADLSRVISGLPVSKPEDPLEIEASRIASAIVAGPQTPDAGMIHGRQPLSGIPTRSPDRTGPVSSFPSSTLPAIGISRATPASTGVATKGSGAMTGAARPAAASSGPAGSAGRPLPSGWRSYFEPRLGADLGGVRLHAGAEAAEAAREVGALAFTVGTDIYFGDAGPDFGSSGGRELLAHELVHTVQQGAGAQAVQRQPDGDPTPETPSNGSYKIAVVFVDDEERPHIIQAYEQIFFIDTIRAWSAFTGTQIGWVNPEAMESAAAGEHIITIPISSYDTIQKFLGRDPASTKGGSIYSEKTEGKSDPTRAPESASECLSLIARLKKLDIFPDVKAGENDVDDIIRDKHLKELPKAGFKDFDDFDKTQERFITCFLAVGRQYAFDLMAQSEPIVTAEQKRYKDIAQVQALQKALGVIQPQYQETNQRLTEIGMAENQLESNPNGDMMVLFADRGPYQDEVDDVGAARNEMRSGLASQFPILADPKLDIGELISMKTEDLQKKLVEHADNRMSNITTTRNNLATDLGFVRKLDNLFETTKERLHLEGKSAPANIINEYKSDKERSQAIIEIGISVVALGLALSGLVLIPAALGLGLAAHSAYEGFREKAAAGTSFDPALALSSNDPNLYWLAADIVASILDFAPLLKGAKVMTLAGPSFFAIKRGMNSAKEAEDIIVVLRRLAKEEGEKLAKLLKLTDTTAEKFVAHLTKLITTSAEESATVGARMEGALATLDSTPELVSAIRQVAPGLEKEALSGLTHFDDETRAAFSRIFENPPETLPTASGGTRKVRISGKAMKSRKAALTSFGMMAHTSPEFVHGVQSMRQGLASIPGAFEAVLQHFGPKGPEVLNIFRAFDKVGVGPNEIADLAKTLKMGSYPSATFIQDTFAPELLSRIAKGINKGDVKKLFEVTDLLHTSQSGSIFESWMKEHYHASGAGRVNVKLKEGKTVTDVFPDNVLRNPTGLSLADYKHLRAEGAFGEREVEQLKRYKKIIQQGMTGPGGKKYTQAEYFFSTKQAAEKNRGTIQDILGKQTPVHYLSPSGTLERL